MHWRIFESNFVLFKCFYSIVFSSFMSKLKLWFYVLFNSQGHIGTGPQHYHLSESNPRRDDSL